MGEAYINQQSKVAMFKPGAKAYLVGLLVTFLWISPATARQHLFAGRWSEGKEPGHISIGITQHNTLLIVFSPNGWLVAEIEPGSEDRLASGKGKWTGNPDLPLSDVTFKIGVFEGEVLLLIEPADPQIATGPWKLKLKRKAPPFPDYLPLGDRRI